MPRHAPGSTPRARWPTIRASQPQVTRMYSAYLWVKSFHILFVVAWMSSVFYLPRILVNVAEAGDQAAVRERLLLMGRRLYRFGHNMFGLDLLHAADGGMFVAEVGGELVGLAEASLRHDYVNGTTSSPVGFLEAWYVAPAWRGRGVGRALLRAVEGWTRALGCTELASDALLDNTASHAAHRACGFVETERVVYFRKRVG